MRGHHGRERCEEDPQRELAIRPAGISCRPRMTFGFISGWIARDSRDRQCMFQCIASCTGNYGLRSVFNKI